MRTAFAVLVLALAASCGGCGPSGNKCHVDNECNSGDVCLASHACAPKCTSAAACGTDQKCSTSGGCVPMSGCGADSECGNGQVCEGVQCVTSCLTAGCSNGGVCQGDGHCSDPNYPSDGGVCGGELFQATQVQANFLIVLDHSGSMTETLAAGQSKWQVATDAIKSLTVQYDSTIRFGLSMFSSPTHCDPGHNYVPVGDMTAGAIASALPSNANGNGTPIGAALELAVNEPSLADPTRANFVLLATDGEENCGGDPQASVTALAAKGVKTYVVGFGSEVNPTTLTNMAIAGGTARAGATRYYQADDPATLDQAFQQIAAGAVGCDFKLASTPPDLNQINVVVGNTLIPEDPSNHSGWDYNAASNRITLYGPACDMVQQQPGVKVSIIYGCPNPGIVETGNGGDGGFIGTGPGGSGGTGGSGGGGGFNSYDGGLPGIN